ncbi:MAG: hypothetical protein WC881_04210 [Elusimicrobiota bacterium]|jgi:hypothetical protein
MKKNVWIAALVVAGVVAGRAQGQEQRSGVLNLNCVEALVAVEHTALAGVFSFVSEKDSNAAFADLVAHDGKALKKYVAKLEKDVKASAGITAWDHDTVLLALGLFTGPVADTLEKPGKSLMEKLTQLSMKPTMTLEQITAQRKK